MNIEVQCCGLAIMIFLLGFYVRRKSVGLYTERFFIQTMVTTMTCVVLDVLSVIVINYRDAMPVWVTHFVCKTYVFSVVCVAYIGILYVSMELYTRKAYITVSKVHTIILALMAVTIYCLPIYIYQNGRVVYTYGASVVVAYAFATIFVCISFYTLIHFKHRMNLVRRKAVILWMGIWLTAAIIQFFNNELLLLGFSGALGAMVLFFKLENPEANLDRKMGCFNSYVLMELLKQKYSQKESFSLFLISFEQISRHDSDGDRIDEAMRELVERLYKFSEGKVFKNVERELVMVFQDKDSMQRVFDVIYKEIQEKQKAERKEGLTDIWKPVFILMPDSSVANSAEENFKMFRYFHLRDEVLSNKQVFYIDEEFVQQYRNAQEMKEAILSALEEDRVEVFYQPIYGTKEKKFISAEALVRIRQSDGSILPPGMFIPIAEETGLITRLGERVFEKTCRFIKEHDIRKYGVEYIEVNLSVLQCEQNNLADIYKNIISKYDIDPSLVNLEITETASIQTKKALLMNMKKLMDYGVPFSLDDFGNGQSNLNYIIDMPVQIIKLDMSMTQAYFKTEKARIVVEATVAMVHDMHLKLVAEGVETKKQLDTLTKIGVDYIQGYYFSKPLPEAEYLIFMQQH